MDPDLNFFARFYIPLRIVNWIIRALRETEKVLETLDCENTSRIMSKLVFVVICMLAAVNAYSANGQY